MTPPKFRLACCLCEKNIPLTQDVFALDAEWQRRFPAMRGILACQRCATGTYWCCTTRDGQFEDGHIAAPDDRADIDAWSHILLRGTHKAMVLRYPRAGMRQGAEEYVRHTAERDGVNPEVAARLRTVLASRAARPVAKFGRTVAK